MDGWWVGGGEREGRKEGWWVDGWIDGGGGWMGGGDGWMNGWMIKAIGMNAIA